VLHWLDAADIEGMGEVIVAEAVSSGLVKTPADLYRLVITTSDPSVGAAALVDLQQGDVTDLELRLTSTARAGPRPPEKPARLAELERVCAERGVPHTPQRRAVLDAVLDLDTHPTADEVFEEVAKRQGRTSRATVFRALDSLVELGLLGRTCHPGKGMRYDRVTTQHHHLVCLRCEGLTDIVHPALDALRVPETSRLGFAVTDFRVQLRGVCKRCREEETR
jgi:Fur family peroxide stress response transcriptional regulator